MLEAWEVEETPIWLTWQEIRALDETLQETGGFREMLKGTFSSARSYREGNTPFRQHSLSTSPFYLISQLAQPGLHLIAMIALNLDHAILDGASGAT